MCLNLTSSSLRHVNLIHNSFTCEVVCLCGCSHGSSGWSGFKTSFTNWTLMWPLLRMKLHVPWQQIYLWSCVVAVITQGDFTFYNFGFWRQHFHYHALSPVGRLYHLLNQDHSLSQTHKQQYPPKQLMWFGLCGLVVCTLLCEHSSLLKVYNFLRWTARTNCVITFFNIMRHSYNYICWLKDGHTELSN